MTTTTNRTETSPEANTYRISARADDWGTLIASGIGPIGIVRKPVIIRDIYTCEQLCRSMRIKRDDLKAMLVAAQG